MRTKPARDVYGGGSEANGVMNVGGDDGGTQLTEADRVVLREAGAGGTTQESLVKKGDECLQHLLRRDENGQRNA